MLSLARDSIYKSDEYFIWQKMRPKFIPDGGGAKNWSNSSYLTGYDRD